MREFTKVGHSVWRSRKFNALGDNSDAKLLYHFLLSCPHANSAGCYDLPATYACSDLGWDVERFGRAMEALRKVSLVDYDEAESTVRIVNWFTFNPPASPNHVKAILQSLKQASSAKLKMETLQELRPVMVEKRHFNHRELAEVFRSTEEALQKGCSTLTSTETLTSTVTETSTDTKNGNINSGVSARGATFDAAAPEGAASPSLGEVGASPVEPPSHLLTGFLAGKGPPAIPRLSERPGRRGRMLQ